MLAEAQSAVVVDQLWFVEGLILVETETVQSADLVSVLVLFGGPRSAVPVLTIGAVTGGELVTDVGNFHHIGVVKLH